MFAVSNRKANRLLKTKRKRLKCDVKRVSSNRSSGGRGGGGVSNGFMTTVVHQNNNNNNNTNDVGGGRGAGVVTENQLPSSSRTQLPPPPPPPSSLPPSLPPLMSDANDDDDDMKLIISTTASVKDNGLYENDTKLLKLIFPTCYQLETFMFLYDFFTLVGEDEKDNHQHNGDVAATNNTSSTTAAEAAMASSSSFGTQRSHFQYLLNNSTTKTQTSKLLNDEDIQSMIVNVSLDQDDFKRKLCSFPNLRIVHENISTCPLAMSECMVNYTVLVLEVKIYSLYRQFILSERNKSSTSGSSTTTRSNQYCARVIPDEDVFMEMKEMWKSYVFTEKYRPHGRRGSDTLSHSNVDTAVWSQYGDKNNTYLAFLQRNGLMSPSGEPVLPTLPSLSSSIFVNYCSFKIEEIQKGTCVNRLKKRIQLEVGPHTLIKYVSIFAEMYKAFITNVKDANKIISDYESVKHKSLKTMTTNDTTASTSTAPASSLLPSPPPPPTPPVRRGRKRKNTEDIIGQYKSLTHKKTKYQSSAAAAAVATTQPQPPLPQPIPVVAPELTTLTDAAVYSHTTQEVLNDTELQEILNNLFSPCSTDTTTTTTDDTGISYHDKPPPVVILNPPPLPPSSPSSPMKYAYVKDITRCMEDSSNFEGSNTSTTTTTTTTTNDDDDDDDTDHEDDDEDVNDDDNNI